MINLIRFFVLFIVLMFATSAIADENTSSAIIPGQYILPGDSGTLKILRGDSGKLNYDIESVGGNCHSCSVSGTIRKGVGYAYSIADDGTDSDCRINFEQLGTEIKVSAATPEECRVYCGARAGFEGTYKRAPSLCSRSSQQNRRNEFLKLYRSRNYTSAIKVLEPLLTECSEFVNWIEIDKIRNDLALAQLHSGNPAAALQTLAATAAASYTNEEKLKEEFSPCDFDNYISVAKATWHNKKLCEKAMRANQQHQSVSQPR